jgi:hypothetical protein
MRNEDPNLDYSVCLENLFGDGFFYILQGEYVEKMAQYAMDGKRE